MPPDLAIGYSILFLVVILLILAVSIGCIESLMARLKMSNVPQFILLLTSVAIIVISTVVLFIRRGIQ